MKAEDMQWDIAYWNPSDKVTDAQLDKFLLDGTGTSAEVPTYYTVRQFVDAYNKQEITDMGWLYSTPRHNSGGHDDKEVSI